MKLEKVGSVRVEKGNCRIRRFKCPVCDTVKTIYAEGYRDEEVDPWLAEEDVKKMYRKEEDARKDFT